MDPERIPVIVGVGQITHRPAGMDDVLEPADLIARSARKAAQDCSRESILRDVEMLGVVNIISRWYADPAGRIAERIGADPSIRWYTGVGACSPQWLVGQAADKVAAGEVKIALVCGGESYASRNTARKHGQSGVWQPEDGAPELVGDTRPAMTPNEERHGLVVPSHAYALFENALRHAKGQSLEEHRQEIGALCAEMSRVAAQNPYAWFRQERSPEQVCTVSPQNRMVAFPYTKLMCSMIFVDQAASALMMSLAEARRRGIPDDRYVYPAGIGEAWDQWYITHRARLHESPSASVASRIALAQAGTRLEEVDHLDLYSCFPCVPRIVRQALEIAPDDPRPLTVTGGMASFGGPGNNYSLHALCTMVELLRRNEGTARTGLVHSLSWYLHKHVVGIYRREPCPEAWQRPDPEPFLAELKSLEAPEVVDSFEGDAEVETYTVVYVADAPSYGFVIARTGAGQRLLARVEDDPDTLSAMTSQEAIGRKGTVRRSPEGQNLFRL